MIFLKNSTEVSGIIDKYNNSLQIKCNAGDMSFKLKPNGRWAKRKFREGIYIDMSIGISFLYRKHR